MAGINLNQGLGIAALGAAAYLFYLTKSNDDDTGSSGGSGSATPTVANIRATTTKEANNALRVQFEDMYAQKLIDYPERQKLYLEYFRQNYYLDLYLRGWTDDAANFRSQVANLTDTGQIYDIYATLYTQHIAK